MGLLNEIAPIAKALIIDNENKIKEIKTQELYDKKEVTIFYFFPAAFTGVCTKSSCALNDDIKEFEKFECQIYGISVDLPFSLVSFMKKNNISYPLISDFNKEMIISFQIKDNSFYNLNGVAKRSIFVIHNGKITYEWIAENPGIYPPFDDLKLHLIELNNKS